MFQFTSQICLSVLQQLLLFGFFYSHGYTPGQEIKAKEGLEELTYIFFTYTDFVCIFLELRCAHPKPASPLPARP